MKRFLLNACLPLLLLVIGNEMIAQNGIVGSGFSTGFNAGDIVGFDASSGTSRIKILQPLGTGNQYFRMVRNWSGNVNQLGPFGCTDTDWTNPGVTYNNMPECGSGAFFINCPNITDNYVFKTPNSGTTSSNFVYFRVQGAIRSVSSASQLPLTASVTPSAATTVTATLDGALSSGQAVYMRYTKDGYTTSTVVQLSGSGTTYTGTIPGAFNTTGANVSYYLFTSGTVTPSGADADYLTINANNNAGSNYTYTVTTPAAIYVHNFGTATFTTPASYNVTPNTFATNLTSSLWKNAATGNWNSLTGSSTGCLSTTGGNNTYTLTFTVGTGFALSVSSFNFWRTSSGSGPQNWSMTINGTAVGTGTVPGTGALIGQTNVSNAINGLTGTITVVVNFTGASGAGTLRLDDFTLNGNVVAVPVSAPVVTAASPLGTFNSAFSYAIVASNSPTSYAIASGSLPSGLSLNVTTGAITGTPTAAGSFTANVTATNSGGTSAPAALSFTIAKANQTITFAALSSKVYGDAAFTLAGSSTSGLIVSYSSSIPTVADVSGNTATIYGFGTTNISASQTGDANYNAATAVVRAQAVTAKPLTINGVTANNKTQDGTTTTTLSGTPNLVGVVSGDELVVLVSGTPSATFASALPATGIAVIVSGFTLTGSKATNYTVSQPTGLTANITTLGTPSVVTASGILPIGFTANWSSVTDATSYVLDVSLYPTFQIGGGSGSVSEGFETGLSTSYINTPTATTLSSGSWTLTNVLRTNVINSGTYGAQLRTSNDGIMISPNVPYMTTATFYARRNGTSGISGIAVYKIVNSVETLIQNITLPASASSHTQYTINVNENSSTDVKLKIVNTGANIANIDDVVFSYSSIIPSFVSGYNSLNVGNVTSYQVTGLNPETAYYYRVRAVRGTARSINSSNGFATTKPTLVTWNGFAWSNVDGPDADIEAIIEGDYNTSVGDSQGPFTAKKLTVSSSPAGSLIIASGTTVTVVNELINNAGVTAVTVENNAGLVQENNVANTGAITVKRNSSALKRLDYTMWSSPVIGSQSLLNFSPLTQATRFYTFDTSNNQYLATPASGTFAPAKGYLIRMPNNHTTWASVWTAGKFTGEPNNGDIDVIMTNGGTPSTSFNAIGNPYPSPIRMDDFITSNSGSIEGQIWFWRKTNNAANAVSYSSCTTSGCALNNGHTYTDDNLISVGQGFMVQAKPGQTEVNFTNALRSSSNVDQFFRASDNDLSRVWLHLSNSTGESFGQKLIAYSSSATLGYDEGKDGYSINESPTALVSLIGTTECVINTRPEFTSADTVVLRFKTDVADTYSIGLNQFDGLFDSDQNIFLKDNLINSIHDLKGSVYTFTSVAGSFDTRFEVVYESALLGIDTPSFTANQVIIYKNNTDIAINSGSVIMASVKVFDIRGRLIAEKKEVNASETTIQAGLANEVLLVQITSDNGVVVTKKVVR